jgi:magnesium transporter
MYYVCFSTATIVASLILFQGFNTENPSNTISLLAGFAVTFLGIHLLELSRKPEQDPPHAGGALEAGLMNPRLSLQGRASMDGWNGPVPSSGGGGGFGMGHGRRGSRNSNQLYRQQTATLFNAFEDDGGAGQDGDVVGLRRLSEERSELDHDEDEMDSDSDDDELEAADERTQLKKKESKHRPGLGSRSTSGSLSNVHSPRGRGSPAGR